MNKYDKQYFGFVLGWVLVVLGTLRFILAFIDHNVYKLPLTVYDAMMIIVCFQIGYQLINHSTPSHE